MQFAVDIRGWHRIRQCQPKLRTVDRYCLSAKSSKLDCSLQIRLMMSIEAELYEYCGESVAFYSFPSCIIHVSV